MDMTAQSIEREYRADVVWIWGFRALIILFTIALILLLLYRTTPEYYATYFVFSVGYWWLSVTSMRLAKQRRARRLYQLNEGGRR